MKVLRPLMLSLEECTLLMAFTVLIMSSAAKVNNTCATTIDGNNCDNSSVSGNLTKQGTSTMSMPLDKVAALAFSPKQHTTTKTLNNKQIAVMTSTKEWKIIDKHLSDALLTNTSSMQTVNSVNVSTPYPLNATLSVTEHHETSPCKNNSITSATNTMDDSKPEIHNNKNENDKKIESLKVVLKELCGVHCLFIIIAVLSCLCFGTTVLFLYFCVKYRRIVTETRILHSITKPLNLYNNVDIHKNINYTNLGPDGMEWSRDSAHHYAKVNEKGDQNVVYENHYI